MLLISNLALKKRLQKRSALANDTFINFSGGGMEPGSLTPLPRGGGVTTKLNEGHLLTLAELVARQPDATLGELRQQLHRETKVEANISTVWCGTERIEFTAGQQVRASDFILMTIGSAVCSRDCRRESDGSGLKPLSGTAASRSMRTWSRASANCIARIATRRRPADITKRMSRG